MGVKMSKMMKWIKTDWQLGSWPNECATQYQKPAIRDFWDVFRSGWPFPQLHHACPSSLAAHTMCLTPLWGRCQSTAQREWFGWEESAAANTRRPPAIGGEGQSQLHTLWPCHPTYARQCCLQVACAHWSGHGRATQKCERNCPKTTLRPCR
jgi:hypothetical protein